MTVELRHQGHSKKIRALIDTGNTLKAGVVMRTDLAQALGLRIWRYPKGFEPQVGTAAQGKLISVRGRVFNLEMRIGEKKIIQETTLVMDQLSSPLNLGIRFLQDQATTLRMDHAGAELSFGPEEGFELSALVEVARTTGQDPVEDAGPRPAGPEGTSTATLFGEVPYFLPKFKDDQLNVIDSPDLDARKYAKINHDNVYTNNLLFNSRGSTVPTCNGEDGTAPINSKYFESSSSKINEKDKSKVKANSQEKLLENKNFIKPQGHNNVYSNLKYDAINPSKLECSKVESFDVHAKQGGAGVLMKLGGTEDKFGKGSPRGSLLPKLEFGKGNLVSGKDAGSTKIRMQKLEEVGSVRLKCQEDFILKPQTLSKVIFHSSQTGAVLIPGAELLEEGVFVSPGVYSVKSSGMCLMNLMNFREVPVEVTGGMEICGSRLAAKGCEIPVEKLQHLEEGEQSLEVDMEKLYQELQLENNELLKKHPKVKKRLKQILYKHQGVFSNSTNGKMGLTKLEEVELKLKPNVQPIRQKNRVFNPRLEADLKEQLDSWLKEGLVQPSRSPWSSPLVPVKKKGGSIRWAVDYRKLNECLEKDSYPLPRIDHLLDRSVGHRYYSTLDAAAAYHTLPLHPDSRKLTAFSTEEGLYEYLRLPFGLTTAVSVYSRFIAAVLNPLGTRAINVFLDDVMVFTNDLDFHLTRLDEVLAAHGEAGIKLNAQKTKLLMEKVTYLGHEVSKEGISMVPEYVERILDWPVPTTPKELSRALGFFGYYQAYIPRYAELTADMQSQKRKKKLEWTAEMNDNFNKLKEKFRTAPVRAAPQFDGAPFHLTTDYSGLGVSAVLSQVQEGTEKLIAAAGRKTTPGEKNYPSWKGELAGLIYGCRKFQRILTYKPFKVYTDASALKHLSTLKQTKGIVGRWISELGGLDFEVIHKPGKLNVNADALSRRTELPEPTEEEIREQEEFVDQMVALDRELIRQEQAKDSVLKVVRGWVSQGAAPSKQELRGEPLEVHQYRQLFGALEIDEDGVLVLNMEAVLQEGERRKILVPHSLKERVFHYSHVHMSAGHYGSAATLARLRRNFYFPGSSTEVCNRLKTCQECIAKVTKANIKVGEHIPSLNGYPLQTLYVDLCGPVSPGNHGYRYILTVEDGYSRFVQAYPLRSKETKEVAKTLMDRFVSTFGCPVNILSDNGKEFASEVFESLMEELQIAPRKSPPYCPQGNIVERFHRTLNAYFRVHLAREDSNWVELLPALALAYNTKTNSVTGITPFLGFFGREARLPVDLLVKLPRQDTKNLHEHVRATLARYREMYEYIKKNGTGVLRRNAHQYEGKDNLWKVGDLVWYLSPLKLKNKQLKHTNAWLGPYTILERRAPVLLLIKPTNQEGTAKVVHIGRVRKYNGPPGGNQCKIPPQWAEGEDDPEAEAPEDRYYAPELGVPVHVPGPVPEISDGIPVKQPDAMEEPVAAGQPQTVEDEILEDEDTKGIPGGSGPKGIRRPLSSEAEGEEAPQRRQRRKLEPRRGERRPRSSDSSEPQRPQPKKQASQWKQLLKPGTESSSPGWTSTEEEEVATLAVKVQTGSNLPQKATAGAAGYDVISSETLSIPPNTTRAVDINLSMQLPPGYYAQLASRSGLAKKGVVVHAGVIDQDYTGPIKVLLHNTTQKPFIITSGQRIAQAIILRAHSWRIHEEQKLDPTGRGTGAFGSTGH